MVLCFGTYASILMKCSLPGTTNRQMVATLVGTIDPDNKYGDKTNDTPVSRLMNCSGNFPSIKIEASNGPIRVTDGSLTNVVALAKTVSSSDVENNFDPVLSLLDEDKKCAAIGALHDLIGSDKTLTGRHSALFSRCMGDTVVHIVDSTEVDLRAFLARVFLYTVLTNENTAGRNDLKTIKSDDYLDRFLAYTVRFRSCFNEQGYNEYHGIPSGSNGYLRRVKDKYDCLPTILHKDPFTPFRDYYVPNDVTMRVKHPELKYTYCDQRISDVTIDKLLGISRFLVLSGTGGLGKSMIMRNLLLSCIDEYDRLQMIPFFIPLKEFMPTYPSLLDYVYDMVCNLWPELDKEGLSAILEESKALLLFDGLDEIRASHLDLFTKHLNAFMDRYSENAFVISSRPYSNFQSFTRFTQLKLQAFSKPKALELIDRFNYRADAPGLQHRFRSFFSDVLYQTHQGFSDNPLLLSIMLLPFEMDADVPTLKYLFYQEAYTVLSKRHDATKDGYKRKLLTGWTANQFSEYFSFFCAHTYRDGIVSFDYQKMEYYFNKLVQKYDLADVSLDDFIYDVTNNLCLMYQDTPTYGFIHRSFQEYFSARFFHNQLDEDLKYVIPVFDRNDRTKKDDSALPMLFDMKPRAVEKYMIIPYMEQLMYDCESHSGIWAFLENLYPDYQAADGDAEPDDRYCKPASNLYAFILDHYNVPLQTFVAEDFPGIDLVEIDKMYYLEDIQEDVWSDDVPSEYEDAYGEPAETGHLYEFEWGKIKDDPEQYKVLIESILDPDKPFMAEYLEVKKLLETLKKKAAAKPKSEDLFDRMF